MHFAVCAYGFVREVVYLVVYLIQHKHDNELFSNVKIRLGGTFFWPEGLFKYTDPKYMRLYLRSVCYAT